MNTTSRKTEFDIFKNYYTAEKSEWSRSTIHTTSFQSKNDVRSEYLRGLVKTDFAEKRYDKCLERYSECLRYATYNGRQYAIALANRSAVYFFKDKYENCLIDINLCLQADYPDILKPKLYIRKAKCFVQLRKLQDKMTAIDDCCRLIENLPDLPRIRRVNYLKTLRNLMDVKEVRTDQFSWDGTMSTHGNLIEKNRLNPNVSAAIQLKYDEHTGIDYVAARDIQCGEVLFVDPAYSVGRLELENEQCCADPFICDYCYMEARNCVPCKICVNIMYCSENCRDEAWIELHQWECDLFRSELLDHEFSLPYRTLIKAALSGAIFQIPEDMKDFKPSEDVKPYVYIYGLNLNFASDSLCTKKLVDICKPVGYMVEFLKKADFFTCLMAAPSCPKDYSTLVTLVGGLLLRHIIQAQQRSLAMTYATSIVLDDYGQNELKSVLKLNSNFHAFCPAVSGVKCSCESNTSMFFNGSTCVVKACQLIKAGKRIFRSGLDLTPMTEFFIRTKMLRDFNINCECRACADVTNNIDVVNSCRCNACGNITLIVIGGPDVSKCLNCNKVIYGAIMKLRDLFKNRRRVLLRHVLAGINVQGAITSFSNFFKTRMKPDHEYFYKVYKELLTILKSKKEFNEVLENFRTCAENRNGRFDDFEYVLDLAFICKACITYLERQLSNLQKDEIEEKLKYVSDVVEEAKEKTEYTFAPLLRLFAGIEYRVFRIIRLARLNVQDVVIVID